MKVEITQPGARDAEGKAIPVGATVEIKGEKVPGYLVNKCRPLGKIAVTNPAENAIPGASAQERQQILGEIAVNDLSDDDFGEDGIPDVRPINKHLPQGASRFTAAERDQIWPGIAEAVMEQRTAPAED